MAAAVASRNPELIRRAHECYIVVSRRQFNSFAEPRIQYSDVDRVGDRLPFNLGSYRLIVGFNFSTNRLFFKELLKHDEYDRGSWKR